MFKNLLQACLNGYTMTEEEAFNAMNQMMKGESTPSQIASLISIMRFRGESVDEMTGFAKAMRSHSVTIETNDLPVIDTCGTGGDELSTFNISTASAIVLSALGVPVAKHGNRAVSSKSGSADVLEVLGMPVQHTPEEASQSLETSNLCFLYAPLYHQSMKHAVVPRKEIGFRTIFNFLGPLTNPANAKNQLLGVCDVDFAKKMAETIIRLGTNRTLFVTGGEGLDELSITTTSSVIEVNGTEKSSYIISPEDVGLKRGKLEDIQVATPAESAELIQKVFKNEANSSARGIVAFNAGAALYVAGKAESIKLGVKQVQEALETGLVFNHFQTLQEVRDYA